MAASRQPNEAKFANLAKRIQYTLTQADPHGIEINHFWNQYGSYYELPNFKDFNVTKRSQLFALVSNICSITSWGGSQYVVLKKSNISSKGPVPLDGDGTMRLHGRGRAKSRDDTMLPRHPGGASLSDEQSVATDDASNDPTKKTTPAGTDKSILPNRKGSVTETALPSKHEVQQTTTLNTSHGSRNQETSSDNNGFDKNFPVVGHFNGTSLKPIRQVPHQAPLFQQSVRYLSSSPGGPDFPEFPGHANRYRGK